MRGRSQVNIVDSERPSDLCQHFNILSADNRQVIRFVVVDTFLKCIAFQMIITSNMFMNNIHVSFVIYHNNN